MDKEDMTMEPIYKQKFHITTAAVDCFGRLKPSMLLYYCQEVAGNHCIELGTDYDSMAAKNMFWAVIRQKVQITRLPKVGETITVETWPMPTTRTNYPRATVGYDAEGNELFKVLGLWVVMDLVSRTMILPKKSGIIVEGTLRGDELSIPGGISPKDLAASESRKVRFSDLDQNGHMNNTRYLEWMDDLLSADFHRENEPREISICYHAEAREGQMLHLNWQLSDEKELLVDALRQEPADETMHHVFAAKVQY